MATVLISAAGGGIGAGAIRSIRRATDHRVVGTDIDREHGGLYLCDAGYVVPPADADGWPSAVADVIGEEDVDVAILLLDAELRRLSRVAELVDDDVEFLASREGVVDAAHDKHRLRGELRAHGITVPEGVLGTHVDRLPELVYPVVVKPRTGQGNALGSGVERFESPEAATAHVESSECAPGDLVVEEYIDGTEYTTEVVGTGDGEMLGIVPKEAVGDDPYHRVTRDAPAVRAACRTLFEELEPAGVMNVQQIVRDGTVYTFEINPRFSASSSLTVAAGVNGFALCIRDALGEDVDPPPDYRRDEHLLRYPRNIHVDALVGE